MKSFKNLIIFTSGFPFGDSEKTFLSPETSILSDHFTKIYLVPLKPGLNKEKVVLPSNVEVWELTSSLEKSPRVFSDYIFVFSLFVSEVLKSGNFNILKKTRYHLSELFKYLLLAKNLNNFLDQNKIPESSSLFYTYWFDQWASILSILKLKFRRNIKFISRAHGFDLYEERSKKGYIFPRQLQINNAEKIFPISKQGENYLKEKFPFISHKIKYSRLGIDKEKAEAKTKIISDRFLLVSCSSLVEVKRVHKIIEILSHSTRLVSWIHFGDGPLKNELLEQSKYLPPHVSVDFKGNVENTKIREFYNENFIDLFINVSESEGIPVSIMEAISYGIPIIATNVGGTKEIVNDITGILIEKEFDPVMVMQLIETRSYSNEQRKLIHDFWKRNFNAELNFEEFANSLQELNL